jgi:hypothetical protein
MHTYVYICIHMHTYTYLCVYIHVHPYIVYGLPGARARNGMRMCARDKCVSGPCSPRPWTPTVHEGDVKCTVEGQVCTTDQNLVSTSTHPYLRYDNTVHNRLSKINQTHITGVQTHLSKMFCTTKCRILPFTAFKLTHSTTVF